MDSTKGKKSLNKDDYSVAWICALPDPEWTASRLPLDEEHELVKLEGSQRHQYIYGSMAGHNIVMGCLPEGVIGKASAAAVASEPRSLDCVSKPDHSAKHGGVIQYDYGKAVQGKGVKQMGTLNKPSTLLLTALGKTHDADSIKTFRTHCDTLILDSKYRKPEAPDRLFYPSDVHPEGNTSCDGCSTVRTRRDREHNLPEVHYGLIASGDQVIKDATVRDDISNKLGDVLCFEMEAAGVVDQISCLVVRAICDYCDSHKNKAWQPYAAAVAAAWAKMLLKHISPAQVNEAAPTTNAKAENAFNHLAPVAAWAGLGVNIMQGVSKVLGAWRATSSEIRSSTVSVLEPSKASQFANNQLAQAWLTTPDAKLNFNHLGLDDDAKLKALEQAWSKIDTTGVPVKTAGSLAPAVAQPFRKSVANTKSSCNAPNAKVTEAHLEALSTACTSMMNTSVIKDKPIAPLKPAETFTEEARHSVVRPTAQTNDVSTTTSNVPRKSAVTKADGPMPMAMPGSYPVTTDRSKLSKLDDDSEDSEEDSKKVYVPATPLPVMPPSSIPRVAPPSGPNPTQDSDSSEAESTKPTYTLSRTYTPTHTYTSSQTYTSRQTYTSSEDSSSAAYSDSDSD